MTPPAKNYRKRVRAVLGVMLAQAKVLAGPRWREPTEAQIEHFVDRFHRLMNWCLDGAARLGYPAEYYQGPLTEAQLKRVEQFFLPAKKEAQHVSAE